MKIILKKRILITLTLLIVVVILSCLNLFDEKKEDIYSDVININIGKCEIDLEKLADLEGDTYWLDNPDYIKCSKFDYTDTKELGDFFSACCCVGFDKKLIGKIVEVSMDWEVPENGQNNFIYYWICNNQPFEGMFLEENGDGTCKMILKGVTRNKTYEEMKQLAQNIVIILKIQYEDGVTETKRMTFGEDIINVAPYYSEKYLDEYIVKKKNTEEE